jgi:hypothetical protein
LDRRCLRNQPAITEKKEREVDAPRSAFEQARRMAVQPCEITGLGHCVRFFVFWVNGRMKSEPRIKDLQDA